MVNSVCNLVFGGEVGPDMLGGNAAHFSLYLWV
jgi:hypothetical protein